MPLSSTTAHIAIRLFFVYIHQDMLALTCAEIVENVSDNSQEGHLSAGKGKA